MEKPLTTKKKQNKRTQTSKKPWQRETRIIGQQRYGVSPITIKCIKVKLRKIGKPPNFGNKLQTDIATENARIAQNTFLQ